LPYKYSMLSRWLVWWNTTLFNSAAYIHDLLNPVSVARMYITVCNPPWSVHLIFSNNSYPIFDRLYRPATECGTTLSSNTMVSPAAVRTVSPTTVRPSVRRSDGRTVGVVGRCTRLGESGYNEEDEFWHQFVAVRRVISRDIDGMPAPTCRQRSKCSKW